MSEQENTITVKILGREYPIKCPTESAHILIESASTVDRKMRELQQSAGKTNTDRVAIVTALNLCRELITLKQEHRDIEEKNSQQVSQLLERIQNVLAIEEPIAV